MLSEIIGTFILIYKMFLVHVCVVNHTFKDSGVCSDLFPVFCGVFRCPCTHGCTRSVPTESRRIQLLVNAEHLLHSMEISRNRDVLQAGGYGGEQGSWCSAQWDSGESITGDADWPA